MPVTQLKITILYYQTKGHFRLFEGEQRQITKQIMFQPIFLYWIPFKEHFKELAKHVYVINCYFLIASSVEYIPSYN